MVGVAPAHQPKKGDNEGTSKKPYHVVYKYFESKFRTAKVQHLIQNYVEQKITKMKTKCSARLLTAGRGGLWSIAEA